MDRRASTWLLGAALFVSVAGGATAAAAQSRVIVLLVQDRVGDTGAAEAVERALRRELSREGRLIDASLVRDAARRVRLRNADTAAIEKLRGLGRELDAEWIVSSTIQVAVRDQVPRLTVSVRVLRAESGELRWAGFEAASGLDSRKVLGLGWIYELEELVERVMDKLLSGGVLDQATAAGAGGASDAARARIGAIALVPFAGLAGLEPSSSAEAATEAVRAEAHRLGLRLLPSNEVHRALRSSTLAFGEVDLETRQALRDQLGAQTILTGAVEAYQRGGGIEPDPRVMISMRLVEAHSGRLLWSGGLERRGSDRTRLFDVGRVYSGGTLSKRVAAHLLQQLLLQFDKGSTG